MAILMFLVAPVLADSDSGLITLGLLAFATLLAALFAAGVRGRLFILAAGLSGFAWMMLVLQLMADVEVLLTPRALISTGFWIVASVAVLARVLRDRRVTLNTVYGALTAYFLIGLAWGFMYDTIEEIDAGAFAFPGPPPGELYGRVPLLQPRVTQTTLGFGDVTPVQCSRGDSQDDGCGPSRNRAILPRGTGGSSAGVALQVTYACPSDSQDDGCGPSRNRAILPRGTGGSSGRSAGHIRPRGWRSTMTTYAGEFERSSATSTTKWRRTTRTQSGCVETEQSRLADLPCVTEGRHAEDDVEGLAVDDDASLDGDVHVRGDRVVLVALVPL